MFRRASSTQMSVKQACDSTHPIIGLPRALLYHKYAPMWTHFFRAIGCETLVSPNTNRQILEQGIRNSIDENCLAVKIFLGHVQYLLDKVDYLFIPHIECLHPLETMCVKLWALGDIVRNTFPGIKVLEYEVDVSVHQGEVLGMTRLGLILNPHLPTVRNAVNGARAALEAHHQAEIEQQMRSIQCSADCRVVLVAHPYITQDALMGKTVTQVLRKLGVDVVYAELVDSESARDLSTRISTECYWTYTKELLGGIETYRQFADGIVFLMAFPCGPDSLIYTLSQYVLRDIPVCLLNMDELQGDAGLKTRLESFVDILRLNKEGQS